MKPREDRVAGEFNPAGRHNGRDRRGSGSPERRSPSHPLDSAWTQYLVQCRPPGSTPVSLRRIRRLIGDHCDHFDIVATILRNSVQPCPLVYEIAELHRWLMGKESWGPIIPPQATLMASITKRYRNRRSAQATATPRRLKLLTSQPNKPVAEVPANPAPTMSGAEMIRYP